MLTKILILCMYMITAFGCSKTVKDDQVLILELIVKETLDINDAVYLETLNKDIVEDYLGLPIDTDMLLRTILFPKNEILYFFDQNTLSDFSRPLRSYNKLQFNMIGIEGVTIVTDEDIPDYVRFQQPNPHWEVDFTNVLFFSTPLVSDNKAILLSNNFASHGNMTLHFFIKTAQEWSWLGKTSISPIRAN